MKSPTPFSRLVPRSLERNLAYRRRLCESFEGSRPAVLEACRRDIVYWVNSFCWTLNPKEFPDAPVRPFITYPKQDELLTVMSDSIGRRSVCVEKSREIGISWLLDYVFLHRCMFFRNQSFLLMSYIQERVDSLGDYSSLMPKIDFAIDHLPSWMKPNVERKELSIRFLDTGGSIVGSSTTGRGGRGGRYTVVGIDELAHYEHRIAMELMSSVRDSTNSIFMCSTHKGAGTVFDDECHKPSNVCMRMHWSDIPYKAEGLYSSEKGEDGVYRVEIRDGSFPFPRDYPFALDGKVRSPWYDRKCRELSVDWIIAQEQDIDPSRSGALFFSPLSKVDAHRKSYAVDARHVGYLLFEDDGGGARFNEGRGGPIWLWHELRGDGRPVPMGRLVFGVDVATGSGATPSTICGYREDTAEKVFEFADNATSVIDFALLTYAAARWYRDRSGEPAFVIFEAPGHGFDYGVQLSRLGVKNVYRGENDPDRDLRGSVSSNRAGFWPNKQSKLAVFTAYAKALFGGELINRSKRALDELRYFQHVDGGVEHIGGRTTVDPSAKGVNHGDLTTGDVLAWHVLRQRRESSVDKRKKNGQEWVSGWLRSLREGRELESRKREGWLVG